MKKYLPLIDIFFLGIISLVLNYFNIRICPFYNLFKIPCPGCGLTRSMLALFRLDIKESINANVLGIPLLIFFLIYGILLGLGKESILDKFFKNNKRIVISLSLMILGITYYFNLTH